MKAAVGGLALLIAVALALSAGARVDAATASERHGRVRAELVVAPAPVRHAVAPRRAKQRPSSLRVGKTDCRRSESIPLVGGAPIEVRDCLVRVALLNLPPPRG